MPPLSVTTPLYVIAKWLVSKQKVIFAIQLLGPIFPVHSHTDSTKGIFKELRQKPPESLL